MRKISLLRSMVTLIALSLTFASHAQVREITLFANNDASIFREYPTLNRGFDGNNMICNNDSALDGLSTLGYEEAWINWNLEALQSELAEGEEILYAEAVFFVSWNSTDTSLTQGYNALHMNDIYDGWNEGNGTSASVDNLNGITWNSAKGLGDFELAASHDTILVKKRAATLAQYEVVPVFDAVSREMSENGNKSFTMRMSPYFSDGTKVKKWLGFHTRQSTWNGFDEETGIAVNAPHLIVYVGQKKSKYSDYAEIGNVENYTFKPSEFGYWLVGEDEDNDRLLLNKGTVGDPDKNPSAVAVFNGLTYGDLEISVKAKMNETTAAGAFLPFNDFIMIFGYEDEANFSYFQFIGINESGTYKVIDGVRSLIGDVYPIPPVSDTMYHDYKVTRTGSEVVAYVDDTEYHRVSDDALNAVGKIGIGSHNNTVFFDDFTDGRAVGVENLSINTINVYPNPCRESIIIDASDAMRSFKLVNIVGSTVYSEDDINSSKTRVNISSIPSGVYFIVAEMNDGSSSMNKIIKE